MCWLAFTDTRATCLIFLLGGVWGISNPHIVNFWTPISPKSIKVGIAIWYAGGSVGLQATASKTMVATAEQLTIAKC